VAPKVEEKKKAKDAVELMMEEANEVKPVIKKPRTFVGAEDSDLFDFSDMKIVTGGDQIPKAMDK